MQNSIPAANPVIHTEILQFNLHSFKILRESLLGHEIRRCLWHLHPPVLTRCDFHLRGSVEGKVYKTNPHTLEISKKQHLP
jgi:hypothetical protein